MRKFLLLFFVLVTSVPSFLYSQMPIQWQKSYGGSYNDQPHTTITTRDGGYIIGGTSNSTDGIAAPNVGSTSCLVIKTDSVGTVVWHHTFGAGSTTYFADMKLTHDGNIILLGSVLGGPSHGDFDFFLIKIDANGNELWRKNYGGSRYDWANSIIETPDHGFMIVGSSESIDCDVHRNYGYADILAIKIDSVGIIQWENNFGGSGIDQPTKIIACSDGNYLIAGATESSDHDVLFTPHGSYDYLIIKITPNGTKIWDAIYGGCKDDVINSITETSDHGFVLAGYTFSNDSIIMNHGNQDGWVVKTDSLGVLQWQYCLGGTRMDMFETIVTNPYGFLVGGITNSNNFNSCGNHSPTDDDNSTYDAWLVQLDTNGSVIWTHDYGGSNDDEMYDITPTLDGYPILTVSTLSYNGDITHRYGDYDYWAVKLGCESIVHDSIVSTVTCDSSDVTWDTIAVHQDTFSLSTTQTLTAGYVMLEKSFTKTTTSIRDTIRVTMTDCDHSTTVVPTSADTVLQTIIIRDTITYCYKILDTVSIAEKIEMIPDVQLQIVPNPFHNHLEITTPYDSYEITVRNAIGQELIKTTGHQKKTLDLLNDPGVYYITFESQYFKTKTVQVIQQ